MNSPGSVTRMIQDLRSEDPTLRANAAEQIGGATSAGYWPWPGTT